MNETQARQKIEQCERTINNEFFSLKDEAREVGASAYNAATSATLTATLAPLILCVIGFFCFFGPWFLGILLIGLGIFLSYQLHSRAKDKETRIARLQSDLNSSIDNNSKI